MDIKPMKIYIKFAFIVLIVLAFGWKTQPDDKELFMGFSLEDNIIRPNVVILMDNSGSMNTIVFYPKKGLDGEEDTWDDGYDANISYSGTVEGFTSDTTYKSATDWYGRWIRNGSAYVLDKWELEGWSGANYWTGCYEGDGTPNNFRVGSNGANYFRVGDWVLFRGIASGYTDAMAKVKQKYQDTNGETWFELEDIKGGPITASANSNDCHFQQVPDGQDWKPVIAQLYGTVDHGQNVRYPRNYVEWLFIHASDFHRDAVSHFSTWGTFDVNVEPAEELSNCATPGNDDLSSPNPRIKKVFTRIQAAREVICQVATNSNQIVKLGLFKFVYDNGSEKVEGLTDMSDESSLLVAYKNSVWDIYASTWTPLAEALSDIWYYYKPGPASKTYYPVDYEIANSLVNHSVSNPVTPMDYWCQKNYVVVMTDGESTMDGFNDWGKYGNSVFRKMPVTHTEPWEDWDDGWGDQDNNDISSGLPQNYNINSTYCPNYTCWLPGSGGTDYLDDVAYFLNHQDMFPDDFFGTDEVDGWPGEQNIYTYTIGFNADNHLLLQTAINGDGAYYTATNYQELVEAFQLVITSINLRNYAFSSITAPKKSTTASNEDLTMSYVGYFMPSQASSMWEGHLLAFRLLDAWGFDVDNSGTVESEEFVYDSEEDCILSSSGKDCVRSIALSIGHDWDAADEVPAVRQLYTHNNSTSLFSFDVANKDILQPLFGPTVDESEAEMIIQKIKQPQFADVFHSDVAFIGSPPFGKQFLSNVDPTGTGDQTFAEFYEANKDREQVLYTGTNDGIFHMIYGGGAKRGEEIWGFIPDEVHPSLKSIVLDHEHTYTVDGRISANDIYYQKSGGTGNSWATLMVFGLRRGGYAFYGLDATQVSSLPQLLWKFEDPEHSGQSWGRPVIGRVRVASGGGSGQTLTKWVVVLPGGFEFNSENPNDHRGKAIFMIDASTGDLYWKLAYDNVNGAADTGNGDLEILDVNTGDPGKHLTSSDLFNFSIPSSMTVIDKDNDGYMDAIYFGNVGGHFFKTDISNPDMAEWTTYTLYKTDITTKAQTTIDDIQDNLITVASKVFSVGDGIRGETSFATGYINAIDNKVLTVSVTSGTFQKDETVVCRTYDPIFMAPGITFDTCYKLWATFGTGDRDRPRTNATNGRFIILKDNGSTNSMLTDLANVSFGSQDTVPKTDLSSSRGFYLDFNLGDGEKMFDPDPIILPDEDLVPNIYFNTYRPPETYTNPNQIDNPCAAPDEGIMTVYKISLSTCGTTEGNLDEFSVTGERFTGRIAGGGSYKGKEDVMYISKSGDVADVPGGEGNFDAVLFKNPYHGGLAFWLEKRR